MNVARKPASLDRRIEHAALVPARGLALAEARCTDRAKIATVLEGASLLSLCDAGGCTLDDRWRSAAVDERGRLSGVSVRPGRDPQPVQARLGELLRTLFRSGSRIAGRGAGRRAARSLEGMFASALVPMSSDDAIGLIFETAPFLWEVEFAESRLTLAGWIWRGAERTSWIAGPPVVRRRIYATADSEPGSSVSAVALAREGRWSEAVRRWQVTPPENGEEKLALAESLYSLGRFEAVLLLVADREDNASLALRAGCRLLLGELSSAREVIERLAVRELTLAERLDFGDLALRALSLQGERTAAADWAAQALARARSESDRGRAHLLAATAALDAAEMTIAERHLEAARPLASDAHESWRWHEAVAWLAAERMDGAELVRSTRALLGARRRRMRRFEAGRAWNNLGLGYSMLRDFHRAERAFEQSARLLRRCEGPLHVTLPQANLAEVRLRSGKLIEVEPILRLTAAHNRRTGNWRGFAIDESLWSRFELVSGRPEEALERARRMTAELERRGLAHQKAELAALAGRAAGWLERPQEAAVWMNAAGADGELELEPEEIPGAYALAGEFQAARERAKEGEHSSLWAAVLRGEAPDAKALATLSALDPFRRARLVLDLELVLAGSTSDPLRAEAARQFRRCGANRYAAILERGELGVWGAFADCLESGGSDPAAIARALSAAGHPQARLHWRSPTEELVLVDGHGSAGEEISAAEADGAWILRASRIDETIRAIFALVRSQGRALISAARGARGGRGDDARDSREAGADSAIVGRSPLLLAALERLRQFAPSEMPVLILGESGTGKELAAREIRRASSRSAGAWVTINCAALSETLLLSDLFGHARGAFTGADRVHAGVFESAHGGTVFLDEIGDLPPVAQGNLLRVLQEGEIRRLGETQSRKVDVRLVAATHRDLQAMVRAGRFRQDLYYRLKVCTVTMPPLRERGDDLELLIEKVLADEGVRSGGASPRLTAEARRALAAHSWPGNVRELAHVLRAAATLAGGRPIEVEDLGLDPGEGNGGERPIGDYHREVEEFRRAILQRALQAESGNRAAAARRVGITRQAFSYLVRELGLDIKPGG